MLSGAPGNSGSTDILAMDLTAPGADLSTMGTELEAAIAPVVAVGAAIGGGGTTIDNRRTCASALTDSLTSGIGSLVDADMNVASTRLPALQTREQLGIRALSIANGNSRLVLKLFQAACPARVPGATAGHESRQRPRVRSLRAGPTGALRPRPRQRHGVREAEAVFSGRSLTSGSTGPMCRPSI